MYAEGEGAKTDAVCVGSGKGVNESRLMGVKQYAHQ